jgi:tetratricopeptide (TPR) repeat protein
MSNNTSFWLQQENVQRRLQQAPNEALRLVEQAKEAYRRSDSYTTESLLLQAYGLSDMNPAIASYLAHLYLQQKSTSQALNILSEITQRVPDADDFHVEIGQLFFAAESYDEARQSFNKALQVKPDDSAATLGLALSLFRLGDRQQAIDMLRNALAHTPAEDKISKHFLLMIASSRGFEGLISEIMSSESALSYKAIHNILRKLIEEGVFSQKERVISGIQHLRSLMTSMGIQDKGVRQQSVKRSLLSNILYPKHHWRERALSHYDDEKFNQWVNVEGFEHYESVLNNNRGAILVTGHFYPGRFTSLMLNRRGYETTSLEITDRLKPMGVQLKQGRNVVTMAGSRDFTWHLLQARRALKQNGTVMISGDANRGDKEVAVPFLGFCRPFKLGYASLSVDTGSPVLPVFSSMDDKGVVKIQFQAPLTIDSSLTKRSEKINALVEQFVGRLEAHTRSHIGNLAWHHVVEYARRANR